MSDLFACILCNNASYDTLVYHGQIDYIRDNNQKGTR